MTPSAENNPATCARRPALPDDEPFLRHLFSETHPALQMLPPALRPQLATMQYAGRSLTYSANFPNAESWILLDDGNNPVGRQLVARTPTGYRCIDIAILPAHQRRGLGTAALRLLQQQTAALPAPPSPQLHLNVSRDNPALQLYLRLGFQPIAEDEISYEMKWSAPPAQTN